MTVYISFLTSPVCCYVQENFPAEHFGSIVGLVCAIGGYISLTEIAIRKKEIQTNMDYYQLLGVNVGIMLFLVLNCILVLFMWLHKKGFTFRKNCLVNSGIFIKSLSSSEKLPNEA